MSSRAGAAFARWPLHGNALEMLTEERLQIGEHALLEPGVWLTGPRRPDPHRRGHVPEPRRPGRRVGLVEIGEHCMFANGCFVTDADHRFDDPDHPVPWQGFTSHGPTRVGDNVWCGANVVVTSGVTIGERSVIGANAVVTRDIPPGRSPPGHPRRCCGRITY